MKSILLIIYIGKWSKSESFTNQEIKAQKKPVATKKIQYRAVHKERKYVDDCG